MIEEHVPLAPLTTFRIGGAARYFARVHNASELREAFAFARQRGLPTFVLGAGSNVLVADQGFPGLVLHVEDATIEFEEVDSMRVRVAAGAGCDWDMLVAETVARGYAGFENLSGIPSSVGATPVQNIGAYGCEVGNTIEWVEVYDPKRDTVRRLDRAECAFGYRDSIFKKPEGAGLVVLRVAYMLRRRGEPDIAYKDIADYANTVAPIVTIQDMRNAVLSVRAKKFPTREEAGTAGSFFMNPVVPFAVAHDIASRFPDMPMYDAGEGMKKLSAAWIIDRVLSLRGVRKGDVGTWPAQALIVVNYGNASAHEVRTFTDMIVMRVQQELGITLTREVIDVGNEKK